MTENHIDEQIKIAVADELKKANAANIRDYLINGGEIINVGDGGGMGAAIAASLYRDGKKIHIETHSVPCPEDVIKGLKPHEKIDPDSGRKLSNEELKKLVTSEFAEIINAEIKDSHYMDPDSLGYIPATPQNIELQCAANHSAAKMAKQSRK